MPICMSMIFPYMGHEALPPWAYSIYPNFTGLLYIIYPGTKEPNSVILIKFWVIIGYGTAYCSTVKPLCLCDFPFTNPSCAFRGNVCRFLDGDNRETAEAQLYTSGCRAHRKEKEILATDV